MACETFNAVDWLRRLKAVGGWYALREGEVYAGWHVSADPNDEAARETWREIEGNEDRRAAIRAAIMSQR